MGQHLSRFKLDERGKRHATVLSKDDNDIEKEKNGCSRKVNLKFRIEVNGVKIMIFNNKKAKWFKKFRDKYRSKSDYDFFIEKECDTQQEKDTKNFEKQPANKFEYPESCLNDEELKYTPYMGRPNSALFQTSQQQTCAVGSETSGIILVKNDCVTDSNGIQKKDVTDCFTLDVGRDNNIMENKPNEVLPMQNNTKGVHPTSAAESVYKQKQFRIKCEVEAALERSRLDIKNKLDPREENEICKPTKPFVTSDNFKNFDAKSLKLSFSEEDDNSFAPEVKRLPDDQHQLLEQKTFNEEQSLHELKSFDNIEDIERVSADELPAPDNIGTSTKVVIQSPVYSDSDDRTTCTDEFTTDIGMKSCSGYPNESCLTSKDFDDLSSDLPSSTDVQLSSRSTGIGSLHMQQATKKEITETQHHYPYLSQTDGLGKHPNICVDQNETEEHRVYDTVLIVKPQKDCNTMEDNFQNTNFLETTLIEGALFENRAEFKGSITRLFYIYHQTKGLVNGLSTNIFYLEIFCLIAKGHGVEKLIDLKVLILEGKSAFKQDTYGELPASLKLCQDVQQELPSRSLSEDCFDGVEVPKTIDQYELCDLAEKERTYSNSESEETSNESGYYTLSEYFQLHNIVEEGISLMKITIPKQQYKMTNCSFTSNGTTLIGNKSKKIKLVQCFVSTDVEDVPMENLNEFCSYLSPIKSVTDTTIQQMKEPQKSICDKLSSYSYPENKESAVEPMKNLIEDMGKSILRYYQDNAVVDKVPSKNDNKRKNNKSSKEPKERNGENELDACDEEKSDQNGEKQELKIASKIKREKLTENGDEKEACASIDSQEENIELDLSETILYSLEDNNLIDKEEYENNKSTELRMGRTCPAAADDNLGTSKLVMKTEREKRKIINNTCIGFKDIGSLETGAHFSQTIMPLTEVIIETYRINGKATPVYRNITATKGDISSDNQNETDPEPELALGNNFQSCPENKDLEIKIIVPDSTEKNINKKVPNFHKVLENKMDFAKITHKIESSTSENKVPKKKKFTKTMKRKSQNTVDSSKGQNKKKIQQMQQLKQSCQLCHQTLDETSTSCKPHTNIDQHSHTKITDDDLNYCVSHSIDEVRQELSTSLDSGIWSSFASSVSSYMSLHESARNSIDKIKRLEHTKKNRKSNKKKRKSEKSILLNLYFELGLVKHEIEQSSKTIRSWSHFIPRDVDITVCPGLEGYFERLRNGPPPSLEEQMQYEWFRFSSFHHYTGNGSAIVLARNGFYHDSARGNSETRCFACGVRYSTWSEFDDVEAIHRKLSPNCPHVHGHDTESRNVSITQDEPRQEHMTATAMASNRDDGTAAVTAALSGATGGPVEGSAQGATGGPTSMDARVQNITEQMKQAHMIQQVPGESLSLQPQEDANNVLFRSNPSALTQGETRAQVPAPASALALPRISGLPRYASTHNNLAQGARTNVNIPTSTSGTPANASTPTSSTGSLFSATLGGPARPGDFNVQNTSANTVTAPVSATAVRTPTSTTAVTTPATATVTHTRSEDSNTQQASNTPEAGQLSTPSQPEQEPQPPSTPGAAGGGRRPDEIVVSNPKHPDYASIDRRADSFNGWPTYLDQTARQMAEAGFFYAGVADFTRCYCCGGGLRNWEPGDDPVLEHTRWYPTCNYVNNLKGARYVQAVVRRQQQHMAERQRQQAALARRRDTQQLAPDPMNTPAAGVLREMGYSVERVKEAILAVREQTGHNTVSAQQALVWILDIDENGEETTNTRSRSISPTVPAASTRTLTPPTTNTTNQTTAPSQAPPTTTAPPSVSTSSIQSNESSTSTTAVVGSLQGAAGGSNDDTRKGSGSPSQNATGKKANRKKKKKPSSTTNSGPLLGATGTSELDTQSLKEENDKLREMQTCKICMERPVNITLLPCGHLVCCQECAPKLVKCPICRQRIKGTVKTFMS